ncbi:MAG: Tfp pilus assembly protein FimT/FimU [Pirellulaceae bacterium]
MTLLEILLVMALLVAVAGMAMPALKAPMDNLRLRKAADMVRTEWVRSRVKAMESGRTYTFRYEPAGNQYVVEIWAASDDYLESSDLLGGGTTGMASPVVAAPAVASQMTPTIEPPKTEELLENVFFVGSETTEDMRGAMLAETYQSQGVVADDAFSSPIFFYPDGTTSTARLVIANHRQRQVTLTIRGVTGIVEVSEMVTGEPMP